MWPVSMRVNSPKNDESSLLAGVDYDALEPPSRSGSPADEGAADRDPTT